MKKENILKALATIMFIAVIFFVGSVAVAQDVTGETYVDKVIRINDFADKIPERPYVDSKPILLPGRYSITSDGKMYVIDSYEFNDSETCVFTSGKDIFCGTFEIRNL